MATRVVEWDARSGGSRQFVSTRNGDEYSGMEVGVNKGYATLEEMLADGSA